LLRCLLVAACSWQCGRVGYPARDTDGAVATDGAPADAGSLADVVSSCPWPAASGLLAEWSANDSLDNALPCSPWMLAMEGTVGYGDARSGRAWQFRSVDTSGADPDYLVAAGAAGTAMAAVTVDAWIQQTGFNV
jgi:hypothetical protein